MYRTAAVVILFVASVSVGVVSAQQDVCTLSPSINPIAASMDPLTVSWQFDLSKYTPSENDVIAIYTPSSSDDSNYIGFELLNTDPDWKSGQGSVTFELANVRLDDYEFRVFNRLPLPSTPYVSDKTNQLVHKYHRLQKLAARRGGKSLDASHDHPHSMKLAGPTRLCTSESITFQNPNEPLAGHLTLTDDDTSLLFMFISGDRNNSPTVRWGLASGNYPYSATGSSSTYARGDMCDAPANTTAAFRDPGMIHEITLSQLEGGQRYYYQFGHAATENWSPEYSFVMPVASTALAPSDVTSVFAFGDLGETFTFQTPQEQYPNAIKTVEYLAAEAARDNSSTSGHYVLHIGDLSYARGYAYQWEYFHAITTPLATAYPYLVSIGMSVCARSSDCPLFWRSIAVS